MGLWRTYCDWCGAKFLITDESYGPMYTVTDDGYRVCSDQCDREWGVLGSMESVKRMRDVLIANNLTWEVEKP